MALLAGNPAFCVLGTPLVLRESCCHNQSTKIKSGRLRERQPQRRPRAPDMSLTNDILIKGLEFAVTTYVGNSVVSHQAKKNPESSLFSIGKKRRKQKQAKAVNINQESIGNVVSEVIKIADRLPEFIEKGGPEGRRWVKLMICITIDLVGSGSLGVPFVGDLLDVVTAPVSAAMLQALFGNTFITMAGFSEEILPGTDIIPTATLAWFAENYEYLKLSAEKRSGS